MCHTRYFSRYIMLLSDVSKLKREFLGENTKEKTLMDKFHDYPGGTVVKNPPPNAGDLELPLAAQIIKKSVCNAGNLGSIPGLGRSLGEGNGDFKRHGFNPWVGKFPWSRK